MESLVNRGADRDEEFPLSFLVRRPATTERGRDACVDALTLIDPSNTNLLLLVQERSLDQCLESWRRRVGEEPAELGVVSVGAATRSATAVSSQGSSQIGVTTVEDPGNLTRIGVTVNEHLVEWSGNDNRTVVCGGSLTAMLQWNEFPVVFKFLHVFLRRLRSAEALTHFHLNPDAHTPKTINQLSALFDEVIDEPLTKEGTTPERTRSAEAETMHNILQVPERRQVLWALLDEEETMTVRELAERLVTEEGTEAEEPSETAVERARTELHHKHLAKMDEAGLIEYDEDIGLVRFDGDATEVRSYLLVEDEDG